MSTSVLPQNKRESIGLLVFALMCFGVMLAGGAFTSSSVGSWYQTLDKPAWTPPGWVFGVVWPLLYGLIALSGWLVWRATDGINRALWLWGLQLAINLAWSALFFGLRSPLAGLVCIVVLLVAIIATVKAMSHHSRAAGLLLFPYVAWVSFASALNAEIWCLNSAI